MKWNFWIPSNTLLLLFSCKAMSDSFETPWIITGNNFLGNNTEVCCYFFLQGIFPTQGLDPRLLQWQVDSLPLSNQGNPTEYIKNS